MPKLRILVDLDDVIADFTGAACRLHGWDRKEIDEKRRGRWNLAELQGIELHEFWKPITYEGESFWIGLQSLPWAEELLALVENTTSDWHIITAPSRCPTSHGGKVKWMKRYFGKTFDRFAITPHKEIFAQPHVLLIDDREENIANFESAGGLGITFPTAGNSQYQLAANPMSRIEEQLIAVSKMFS